MKKRNARFWTWENNGWVKLTLKPGESLTHATCGPTDEGYFRESSTWSYEDDIITCDYHSFERDCDGPMERNVMLECNVANLASIPECNDEYGYNPPRPDWEKVNSRQRDYYAESMGY